MSQPTPQEKRAAVLQLCEAWAAARGTGNPLVQQLVRAHIEDVALPQILPDEAEPTPA